MHPFPRYAMRVELIALAAVLLLLLLGAGLLLVVRPQGRSAPVAVAREPEIVVRLLRGIDRLSLTSEIQLSIGPVGAEPRLVPAPATIGARDGMWIAEVPGHAPMEVASADTPIEIISTGPIEIDGARVLPEHVELWTRSGAGTSFDVTVRLPLERYVAGVVSAETYAGWGDEVLKAQAVAARSYAISERASAREARRRYDIDAGQVAQALAVQAREDAAMAAAATRGVVLTSDASVLRAYYSSTCGGRPASAADNWSGEVNEAPPLQARPRDAFCQASPLYRWNVERSTAEFSARIAAWGRDHRHPIASMKVLRRVDIIERNRAGRPTRYALLDAQGDTYRITAESLRLACNHPLAGRRPEQRVHSNDVEIIVDGARVRIDGRGYGHGVGMCQFGAAAMSDRGELWPAILVFFYPGAELQRAYR